MEAAEVERCASLLNKFVEITLHGNSQTIKGTVYTIDPVSQSVVLLTKNPDEQATLQIFMKHAIKNISVLGEVPDDQRITGLEGFCYDQHSKSSEATFEEITEWLTKNRLQFEVKEDVIVVEEVSIRPPYRPEDCQGSNWIVLDRVQKILSQRTQK